MHLQWSRVIILQDIYTKFGQMVRVARAKKGYTQLKLAERLHTTDLKSNEGKQIPVLMLSLHTPVSWT